MKFLEAIEVNPKISLKKDGIYPFVEMANVDTNSRLPNYIDYKPFSSGVKFERNDTVIARIEPCLQNGKKFFVKEIEQGFGSTEYLVFRPKDNLLDAKYLYYLMQTDYIRKSMINSMTGATGRQRVNNDIFKNLDIDVPEIKTQNKIGEILSTYDELIENNQKQIKLLEEAAQRLYKEWFVDLRFPGYENASIIDGVPEGWKESTLREVALLKAGGDRPKIFSKKRNTECNIPVYSNGTEKEGLYGYTNVPEIQDDCVTISARGSVGYICLRRTAFVPIVRLISAIPKNIDVIYLYLYLQNFKFDGKGAAQQQITVPMIKDKSVLLPTKEILDDFAKMVHPMQDAIENCKVQIERLIEARDLLLPKLMSGEIEV